jgi:hypothetical protein
MELQEQAKKKEFGPYGTPGKRKKLGHKAFRAELIHPGGFSGEEGNITLSPDRKVSN